MGAIVLARERWGRSVFVSGFARRRGSNIGESGEHRAIRCQKLLACTLGTLTCRWLESAFFASFLCRFGQRNDVPPRTVANSDKENSSHITTADPSSSNPPLPPPTRTGRPRRTPPPRVRTNLERISSPHDLHGVSTAGL